MPLKAINKHACTHARTHTHTHTHTQPKIAEVSSFQGCTSNEFRFVLCKRKAFLSVARYLSLSLSLSGYWRWYPKAASYPKRWICLLFWKQNKRRYPRYMTITKHSLLETLNEVEIRTLRKHAYSNILKILPPNKWKFSDKKILIFFVFLLKT